MKEQGEKLQKIYSRRLDLDVIYRNRVWQVLTRSFFTRWIKPHHRVLGLGSGYGQVINHIHCVRKFAMDLNPNSSACVGKDVTFFLQDYSAVWPLEEGSIDVMFTSNFLDSSKRDARKAAGAPAGG